MNKSEKEKIAKQIKILDGVVGRLLMASMKDELVSEAMKQVIEVNLALEELF